jgi:2-polyprenyl-3-methyl-5-hydroxy-6-metoxy-1,4-benzoquinol methylase
MTTAIKQEKGHWEDEYESGLWNRLHGSQEFARYTLVSGYIQRSRRQVSLLDIGCGEGVILKHLNLDLVGEYTGIDIAQTALDKIAPKRGQDRYICSSLENYLPDAKWDVVLFNEVLYYTSDPVAQLKKFESSLKKNGCYVISMYRKNNPLAYNNCCIRAVRRHIRLAGYLIEDAVELAKNDRSAAWQIFVVRPSPK